MASKRRVAVWALTCTADTVLTPQLPNIVAMLASRGDFQSSRRESLGHRSISRARTWKSANEIVVGRRAKVCDPEKDLDTNGPEYIENRTASVTWGSDAKRLATVVNAEQIVHRGWVVGAGRL
jgi:hypothetical protein